MAITGLSMAAEAAPLVDPAEIEKFMVMLKKEYPEHAAMPAPDMRGIQVYRLMPKVISVLDYTRGFGHTDLVTI